MSPLSRMAAVVAFVVFSPSAFHAQAPGTARWADSLVRLIEAGTATGRVDGLDEAIALADRVLTVAPKDGLILHYKGYALYRKSNLMMGAEPKPKDNEIEAVLEEAESALEESGSALAWPETLALRASIAGQLIGIRGMFSAMRLGPKADGLMEDAMKIDQNNPRVWMLRGIGALYKPRMFGGGTENAERDIKKAIELFASDAPAAPAPSWGRAEAWAWLGQVYAQDKKVEEARAAYGKALELQPGYGWVTHQLLPALDRVKR